MAVDARELSIQYGTYVVGGAQTDRVLERWYVDDAGYETGVVEFTFMLRGASQWTEAEFNSALSAAESAFNTPHQALTITQGSETLKSWSHSSNTGFNARATIQKSGGPGDTGRSRRYKVRIEFDLPASPSSSSGRRVTRGAVNVSYSPSRRRTVTITPQYTALSSNSARDQYEGAIAAYATSVLNALGGSYKILEEPTTQADDPNKLIDITRTYEEVIFTNVGSSDADVRGEKLEISRARTAPGDTPVGGTTVERLVTLTATYTAWIDKEQSTNLVSKWKALFPKIVTRMRTILAGGSIAIIEATPRYDDTENRIDATVVAVGSAVGDVIRYTETVSDPKTTGIQAIHAWDGGRYSRYTFQGGGTWQRKVTQVYETLGSSRLSFNRSLLSPPAGMKSFELSDEPTVKKLRRGFGSYTLDTVEVTRTITVEFYTEPEVSTGGTQETGVMETTGDEFIDGIIAQTSGGGSGG